MIEDKARFSLQMRISRSMRILSLLIIGMFLMDVSAMAHFRGDESPNRLFHVERSKNRNIVCYDANVSASGSLDSNAPVTVYWINMEEHPGERNGLNVIQRRLAYGYKVEKEDGSVVRIALNACNDRPMEIVKVNGHYSCILSINQKMSKLTKVYVKTKESNSLSVEYIELYGETLDSGATVVERIVAK